MAREFIVPGRIISGAGALQAAQPILAGMGKKALIVTDEVIEAPTSLVIPEAANREISATVVLKRMLEGLE